MSIFTDYLEKGIIIIPQRDYHPLTKWARFYDPTNPERPSDADIKYYESFFPDSISYAMVCGSPSNIVWVDIDVDDESKIQKLRESLKPVCERFGSKGIAFAFEYNGEESAALGDLNGSPMVEIKSTGSLITIPPSKLPDKKQSDKEKTKYYNYTTGDILTTKLTKLPINYIEIIKSIYSIIDKEPEYIPSYTSASHIYNKISEVEVAEALTFLSSDISYKEWAAIGGCIYSEFKGGGFYLFDDWAAKAGNRYNRRECAKQYNNSIKYKKYSIGTIIKLAQNNGWIYQSSPVQIDETRVIDIKNWTKKNFEKKASEELKRSEGESLLIQNAPPLIKGLVEWICSTAMYSQPLLSLGAVITTLGFVMGRKFHLEGKRSNIYSVCLAGSQQGKEHVKEAVKKILYEADMQKHYERTWSSGAAIESALAAKKGEVLYCTEEMGILMRGMTGKFADKNQNDAQQAITELATSNYYVGKGYANRAERPTMDLPYPNCGIIGFAQPEIFFESFTSADALSGFLNRLFIFQAPKLRPKHNENRDYRQFEIMPERLRQGIKGVTQKYKDFLHEKGGFRVDISEDAILKPIEYDEETKFYKLSLMREIDIKFNDYQKSGDKLELIIGRAVESMERLAIIAALGETINIHHFKWAQSVVEYTIGLMCQASTELIGDSVFERDCNKVLRYITENIEVSQTQLGQRFRRFTDDEMNKIIIKLSRMEAIKVVAEDTGRKKRTIYQSLKELDTSVGKFALVGKSMQGAF